VHGPEAISVASGRLTCHRGYMRTSKVVTFFQDSSGQDAVEYALLTGFLCLACAAILSILVTDLGALWTYMNNLLSNPG